MAQQWGPQEVAAYLRRMQAHFSDRYAPHQLITGEVLCSLLEEYDEVEPVTQEQANMITEAVILGLEALHIRKSN